MNHKYHMINNIEWVSVVVLVLYGTYRRMAIG